MDMNLLESVKRIVDYLHPHEKRSFEEFISGEYKSLSEHIFYDIDKVKNWFDSQKA